MDITEDEIRRRLTNQVPRTATVADTFDDLTAALIELGTYISRTVPPGREKSLAVTALEEVSFWAKKGLALNQGAIDPAAADA